MEKFTMRPSFVPFPIDEAEAETSLPARENGDGESQKTPYFPQNPPFPSLGGASSLSPELAKILEDDEDNDLKEANEELAEKNKPEKKEEEIRPSPSYMLDLLSSHAAAAKRIRGK